MWRFCAFASRCRHVAGAVILVALAATPSGCGSSSHAAATHGKPRITVGMRDFKLTAPRRIPAGEVTLAVRNGGPDLHELIVVREGAHHSLPLRGDGLTVDEERLQSTTAAALEPEAPGSAREVRVNLRPGRYILFCNMSGHYLGGMHTEIEVG
jgi:uncharacterized cupredoxin-like copper-binding protein